MAFTDDTGPGPALRRLAQGVDLLICECGRRSGDQNRIHLGPSDVSEIADAAGCGRVALTHLYSQTDPERALAEARERCGGELLLASDRMEIELG
jgi:ribonuclease BN (tRNA processing enzyme)